MKKDLISSHIIRATVECISIYIIAFMTFLAFEWHPGYMFMVLGTIWLWYTMYKDLHEKGE